MSTWAALTLRPPSRPRRGGLASVRPRIEGCRCPLWVISRHDRLFCDVRFTPDSDQKSDIASCPLCANRRHRRVLLGQMWKAASNLVSGPFFSNSIRGSCRERLPQSAIPFQTYNRLGLLLQAAIGPRGPPQSSYKWKVPDPSRWVWL